SKDRIPAADTYNMFGKKSLVHLMALGKDVTFPAYKNSAARINDVSRRRLDEMVKTLKSLLGAAVLTAEDRKLLNFKLGLAINGKKLYDAYDGVIVGPAARLALAEAYSKLLTEVDIDIIGSPVKGKLRGLPEEVVFTC